MSSGRIRRLGIAAAAIFVLSGCLSLVEPSPSPPIGPSPTPLPSPKARTPGTLVVMAPEHPVGLLPPAANATEMLLIDLLYDPLYRLDEQLRPVPEVALELPTVSDDGLTWRVPIRPDARFHDGLEIRADDVAFSLRLAASPTCPLGRDLCTAVGAHLATPPAVRGDNVIITLEAPHTPFLAEALGRLPILSQSAVRSATDELIEAAGRLGDSRPDTVVARINGSLTAERCVAEQPPEGCRLPDYRAQMEGVLERARMSLPAPAAFTDTTGLFDEHRYSVALLDRLYALGQVLNTEAADRQAAALALLDVTSSPLGGGPFRLDRVEDGTRFILNANRAHAGGPPGIDRVEVVIERDAAVAATRLLTGEADWILAVGPEQAPLLRDVPGIRFAERALPIQRGILFNVRPGRIYFEARIRRAFSLCLDHDGLARQLDPERPVARAPYAASSWALPQIEARPRDVEAATALLEAGGWQVSADGIREREGVRLSSSVAVRPSRVDLLTFAYAAAEQLSECGIELAVEELDLTGDTMLSQLQWPNEFDTLLLSRPLGADPDTDVRVFESSRITNRGNPADANAGGFTSALADHLIDQARTTLDEEARRQAYTELQAIIEEDVPYWPLWYDSVESAISDRVLGPSGPLDPSSERYAWDVSGWTVRVPAWHANPRRPYNAASLRASRVSRALAHESGRYPAAGSLAIAPSRQRRTIHVEVPR